MPQAIAPNNKINTSMSTSITLTSLHRYSIANSSQISSQHHNTQRPLNSCRNSWRSSSESLIYRIEGNMNQSWANAGEPVTSRYVYTIILHVGTAMWFSACPASNVINPQVDDVASHIIHNYSCVGHAMWGFRWCFVRPWKGFLPSIQWVNILRHCFSMFPNSEKGDAEPQWRTVSLTTSWLN